MAVKTGFLNKAQFFKQLDDFIEETGVSLLEIVKRVGFGLLKGVVMKTPVKTGLAQGNWYVGIGSVVTKTGGSKGAGPSLARGRKIGSMDKLQAVYISNSLPYIAALENGHSTQSSPGAMAAGTVAEQRAILHALVATESTRQVR